jgi:hypothetical protein
MAGEALSHLRLRIALAVQPERHVGRRAVLGSAADVLLVRKAGPWQLWQPGVRASAFTP